MASTRRAFFPPRPFYPQAGVRLRRRAQGRAGRILLANGEAPVSPGRRNRNYPQRQRGQQHPVLELV